MSEHNTPAEAISRDGDLLEIDWTSLVLAQALAASGQATRLVKAALRIALTEKGATSE